MRLMYLIVFTILLVSCEELLNKHDDRLKVINTSNFDLHVFQSYAYPDTLIAHQTNCPISSSEIILKQSTSPLIPGSFWERRFKENDSGRIILYFFNYDTVQYYYKLTGHCDSLYERRDLILKTYTLTLDSLIKYNWVLTYP